MASIRKKPTKQPQKCFAESKYSNKTQAGFDFIVLAAWGMGAISELFQCLSSHSSHLFKMIDLQWKSMVCVEGMSVPTQSNLGLRLAAVEN